MTDAPKLLDVAVVKRLGLKTVREKSVEHGDVCRQRVGGHRKRPPRFGVCIEDRCLCREIGVVPARVPREQIKILSRLERLVRLPEPIEHARLRWMAGLYRRNNAS